MSDRVNLVAPASPIDCLLHLPNVRAMHYKLGPERLTRLRNSNVLWLPVKNYSSFKLRNLTLLAIFNTTQVENKQI